MVEVKDNIQDAEQFNNDLNKNSKDAKRSLAYFWDYYKWYVIIPVVSIAIIISLIVTFVEENKKKYLSVAMVNVTKECDDLFKEYENSIGESITLVYDYRHLKNSDDLYSYNDDINASVQKLQANITSGRVDVICTNSRAIEEYSVNSCFIDLRTILDQEYLNQYEDLIYYYNDIPVGIDVSESEIMMSAYSDSDENHYIVVSAFSKNIDNALDFIVYLYPQGK